MASIKENRKNGQIVSYRFSVYLGRTPDGKQLRQTLTWTPPEGLTPVKARKAAERAAADWEAKLQSPALSQQEAAAAPLTQNRRDDFVGFASGFHLCFPKDTLKCEAVSFAGRTNGLVVLHRLAYRPSYTFFIIIPRQKAKEKSSCYESNCSTNWNLINNIRKNKCFHNTFDVFHLRISLNCQAKHIHPNNRRIPSA